MSDYFSRCQEARELGDMRRARRPKLSEERHKQIGDEIAGLYKNLGKQSAAEQLMRYVRILDLGKERGWVYDPDPAFDLVRIRCIKERMEELGEELRDAAERQSRTGKKRVR